MEITPTTSTDTDGWLVLQTSTGSDTALYWPTATLATPDEFCSSATRMWTMLVTPLESVAWLTMPGWSGTTDSWWRILGMNHNLVKIFNKMIQDSLLHIPLKESPCPSFCLLQVAQQQSIDQVVFVPARSKCAVCIQQISKISDCYLTTEMSSKGEKSKLHESEPPEASPKRGPTLSTSTSSFEALDPHDPQLNQLASVMFTSTSDWVTG